MKKWGVLLIMVSILFLFKQMEIKQVLQEEAEQIEMYHSAQITYIIDGDTFKCYLAGREETIRLIGVDTPETYGKVKEAYGLEATAFVKNLLQEGCQVYLTLGKETKDKYGRLLCYTWLNEKDIGQIEASLNGRLLIAGYGKVMNIEPNSRYKKTLITLENQAKKAEVGIWSR